MYQNLFDSHTHSDSSLDGHHSVTFMVETAVEKGFQGLAVTDHCDCEALEKYGYETRMRQVGLDVAMAKAAFRNQIILTKGIELGQPHLDYQGADRMLSGQHFDFVLLALHRLRGRDDLHVTDFSQLSPEDIHRMMLQYFDELLEIVQWGNFDSLAHLSLPMRYLCNYNIRDIDLATYDEQIDEILKVMARTGKALELNTSGLRGKLRDTMPPFWVVERFHELGGERITLGSDAHTAGDIGMHIRDGMHLLLELGFEYFAFYRDRQPVMLRII